MEEVIEMMTLSKLAKLANVSVSTASKAFTGSPEVNSETRELIFSVAKAHGCFKKFYNAKYPKLVIAVIAPEFSSGLYARYLSLIQQTLEQENCELCVSTTNFSIEQETALLEYYDRFANADGILIVGAQSALSAPLETPIVFLSPAEKQPCGVSICSDHGAAIEEAFRYLKGKQVSSVGFIGEKLTKKKERLFRQWQEASGLTCDEAQIQITDRRFEAGGYAAMEKMFEQKRLPRAVICAYDTMAIGAIRCICDHGLSVPKDIAVLGMDDIREAAWLNPPLASISSSVEEACRLAAEAVLRQLSGEAVETQQTIPAKFHLRRSFEID